VNLRKDHYKFDILLASKYLKTNTTRAPLRGGTELVAANVVRLLVRILLARRALSEPVAAQAMCLGC
jgi:hypothetical protein